ncbi:MAG: tyrosine-type recombinase/integrase [Candidatus Competibacteraceae bacterium]|nr:tyrosine-type recombinase/integrase [Candidatus Competibacteraceae bacterium]
MPLTDATVRTAKPADKPLKLFDAGGLYLLVTPQGGKWWRWKYRTAGKEKLLSLGVYPETGLREARQRRDDLRQQLRQGIDPSTSRKAQRATASGADSFEAIAREWFAAFSKGKNWAPNHASKIIGRLENDIFPWLGASPLNEITAPQLLAALRRIEARGALESAHRALQACGRIFTFAIATGRAERNPATDLRGALPTAKGRHFPTLTDPKIVGALLRAIEGYTGTFIVRCALRLAPLLFVRPGELRRAEWSEFDLDAAVWRIPADKMKMGAEHIVPLPHQAVAILKDLHPLTGRGRYLFPSERGADRSMSANSVNAALRRMGYAKHEITGHGFRSMASTLLNEQGWNRDAIERQLAHMETNAVRGAYNRAEHLPERRRMMQAWADYLDGLKQGATVVAINRTGH